MTKKLGIALLALLCIYSLSGCAVVLSELRRNTASGGGNIKETKNPPVIQRVGEFPPGSLIEPDDDHHHWRIEYGDFPHMDGSRMLERPAEAFARAKLPRPDGVDAQITSFTDRENAIDAFASGRTVTGGFLDSSRKAYVGLYDVEQMVFFADSPLTLLLLADFTDDDGQRLGDVVAELFAWDELLFIVSSDHPVEGLSIDQLRRVLTGEITNWKELGGDDLPIALHLDPGEMTGFLDRTVLRGVALAANALAEFEIPGGIPGGDSYTIEQPSPRFDYAPGSLGLIRRSEGDSSGRAKVLAIEGVSPGGAAVSEYPLAFGCYAVYRAQDADGGPGRFAKWMRSEEGQALIGNHGFIPISGEEP